MKALYNIIINLILVIFLFALNIQAQNYKIVLSSNSLEPPGIYGTNSLTTGSFAFAYDSYWLNGVYEVYLKSGHEDKAWKLNIGVFKIRKGKTWVHREKEKFIAMSLKPVQ